MVTDGKQEKCIDISLAVEMLFMATVNAYDIAGNLIFKCGLGAESLSRVLFAISFAVIVAGDKDFLPALQKTRLIGKRVAVCSMRNGCSKLLVEPEANARDFDVIWMDDYLEQLVVPNKPLPVLSKGAC